MLVVKAKKIIWIYPRNRQLGWGSLFYCVLTIIAVVISSVNGQRNNGLRYTEASCSDLVPRNVEQYGNSENGKESEDSFFGLITNKDFGVGKKRKKRQNYYADVPFNLVVDKQRYMRSSDIIGM